MEFEYTATVFIDGTDMDVIYEYVRKGGNFDTIFEQVMGGYDDCDYFASYYVRDQVKKEIENRIRQSRNEIIERLNFARLRIDNCTYSPETIEAIDKAIEIVREYFDGKGKK